VPAFKPAYLIHGDDHGRIAERRARLRALAEAESGAGGVQVLEGEAATVPAAVAALSALTFALGRRFVIVDGVERWKDADVAPLATLLADPPPDTTVAFFAREEGRAKAPEALHAAVRQAGGDVAHEGAVKPWELPKWVAGKARELGLELEPGAAKALVAQVGERQPRLARELERIAVELGPGARLGPDDVADLAAGSAERKAFSLADALVAGDREHAVRFLVQLRAQGERLPGLLYVMVQRTRQALDVATRLERGEPAAQVKRSLRMPAKAAERFLADVQRRDRDALRATLEALADLELASRGGETLAEDTVAVRALVSATPGE
jgi:DNA polymerase-3 subunit delta